MVTHLMLISTFQMSLYKLTNMHVAQQYEYDLLAPVLLDK